MKKLASFIVFTLFLVAFVSVVEGQVQTPTFGDPAYWDSNIESDMDFYEVYRGGTPCSDPTPNPITCPTYTLEAAVPQGVDPIQWIQSGTIVFVQDYYYRVLACNTSGLCSNFSNELNIRWLNPDAPVDPTNLRVTQVQANRFILDWDDVATAVAYDVYVADRQQRVWSFLSSYEQSMSDEIRSTGNQRYAMLRARDASGNFSGFSEIVELVK